MRSVSTLTLASLVSLVVGTACSSGGGGTGTGATGGSTSGTSGASDGAYTIINLDPNAQPETSFNVAIGPGDKIGVVYFNDGGGSFGGDQNIAVIYTEVTNKAVSVAPEIINTVQNGAATGCTVAFQPSGEPAIGYQGGLGYAAGPLNDSGITGSLFWLQSQAEIDYRAGANSWTRDVCMLDSTGGSCAFGTNGASCVDGAGSFIWTIEVDGVASSSAELLCNNPMGEVVGLWPSLLFDGGTAVMAYRDVHEGQFPIQDWGASDAKMCIGGPGGSSFSWSAPLTVDVTGLVTTNGYGVHNQILFIDGLVAEIADSSPKDEGVEASGAGPIAFTIQTGSSTQSNADWTPPVDPFDNAILNPGSGPSMVYNPIVGVGVAAVDTGAVGGTPALYYTSCTATPVSQCEHQSSWATKTPVYQVGSGGFFPDLQIDPVTNNPIVSYTICSLSAGMTPDGTGCDPTDAELDVAEGTAESWNSSTVLKGQFWHPRFRYLSTGKKVFVYSDLLKGGLYVAIEN